MLNLMNVKVPSNTERLQFCVCENKISGALADTPEYTVGRSAMTPAKH